MKQWLAVLQCVLILSCMICGVSASDRIPEGEENETPETETFTAETEGGNITINVTVPAPAVAEPDVAAAPEDSGDAAPDDLPGDGWQVVPPASYALDDVPSPSADTPTLSDTLQALFGQYTPRTQTVTEHLADGSTTTYTQIVPGLAGLDWPWLTSAALFGLFLYCLLRIVGGLLKL